MARSNHYFALLPAVLLAACNAKDATQAPTAAATPVIKDGSLMVPGRPQLAALPAVAMPGAQQVEWNLWWGENGSRWVLLVNGDKVDTGKLPVASPKAQQGKAKLQLDKPGSYEIRVSLCNDHGCSESEPAVVQVGAG